MQRHAGLLDLSTARLLPKEPDSGGSVMCLAQRHAQVHRISRVKFLGREIGCLNRLTVTTVFVVSKRYPVLTAYSKDWSNF